MGLVPPINRILKWPLKNGFSHHKLSMEWDDTSAEILTALGEYWGFFWGFWVTLQLDAKIYRSNESGSIG